jgi:hypothetical protein
MEIIVLFAIIFILFCLYPSNALLVKSDDIPNEQENKENNKVEGTNKYVGLCYNLALKLAEEGNHQLALRYYSLISQSEQTPAYFNDRAFSKSLANDYYGAIEDYTKAIELAPFEPSYYINRGILYRKNNHFDLALSDYRKAEELGSKEAIDLKKTIIFKLEPMPGGNLNKTIIHSETSINTEIEVQNEAKLTPIIADKEKPKISHSNNKAKKQNSGLEKSKISNSSKSTDKIKNNSEEYAEIKHIGYTPIKNFTQTELINYPIVLMPETNCIIKFPQKGRSGRKGFTESNFKKHLDNSFNNNNTAIFNDHVILVQNSPKVLEPDFTLISEQDGINIYLAIEIDEPYEGLNDIKKRKPIHFLHADVNRNNSLKNRGWIVIRFAEIQIHTRPLACCRFIADVIKGIDNTYAIPDELLLVEKIEPTKQWTKDEAIKWSLEKYRESYLGIERFSFSRRSSQLIAFEETEIGSQIEIHVEDDMFEPNVPITMRTFSQIERIRFAINSKSYLSFSIEDEITIVEPLRFSENSLTAFCFVKNKERNFNLDQMKNVKMKNEYFTLKLTESDIEIEKISNVLNIAIEYKKTVRIRYIKPESTSYNYDEDIGEEIEFTTEEEESIRSISNIQLTMNNPLNSDFLFTPDERHITAYCHKREELRNFRYDRIDEIEILDI